MLIKFLVILSLLFTIGSCSEKANEKRFARERDKRIYSVLRKFKHTMAAKGYRYAGIGEGIDHSTGKQNYLGVTLDIESLPTVEFARKIEVEALELFLKYINSEEGIQDYITEYPYSLKFVDIAFISTSPQLGLERVSNFEDQLSYYKMNPEELISPSIKVLEESYADALQILTQQQNAPSN